MKKQYLVIAAAVLFGFSLLAFNNGLFSRVAAKEAPIVGAVAPNFVLNDLNGKPIYLKNVTKTNKLTLLNFWATWCPPCRAEIPEFVEFYSKFSDKKVEVLAVNLQENVNQVRNFAKNNRMTFPVLTDVAGKVGSTYQVFSIPTTFFIDSKGKIAAKIEGSTNLKTLENKVRSLIGE